MVGLAASLLFLMLSIAMADNFSVDCNFDTGVCGWTQDLTDNFDWTRDSGGTSSDSTGPSGDHTSGSGYYMYIEVSDPRVLGEKARLISPNLNVTNDMFLVFYYHMYGSNINTLNVYISRSGSLGIVWRESGSQGDAWKKAIVQIPGGSTMAGTRNIVFEGRRGDGYKGDIAIDDISLFAVSCNQATTLVHIEPKSDIIRINEGKNLTVRCVIDKDGTAATSILWSHKGQNSSGSVFHLQNVTQSDEGRLTCTAHGGVGTSPGRAATFIRGAKKYLERTLVHLEPNSDVIRVDLGANLTVKCLIDNANATVSSIKWSHKGRASFGSTFHIQNVTQSDEGRLTCTAHNGVGTSAGRVDTFIRAARKHQVPTLVHIEPYSDILSTHEGDNLTVNCVVNDTKPDVISITWSHNRRNSSGPTFHIQNVTLSDEGRLTCTAHNGEGTSPGLADTFIRVLEKAQAPILVHIEPNSNIIRINEGKNLTVKCVIETNGTAATFITWSHNGRNSTGSTLHIQNVTHSDDGRLTCTAHGGKGTSPGRAVTFIRVAKEYLEPTPVHLEPNSDVIRVDLGANLTVKCLIDNANATVSPIRWSHKGRASFGSTFHIQNVTHSDEGRLTCTAHNGVGTSPGRADTFIRTAEKYQVPTLVHMEPDTDILYVYQGENLTVNCTVNDDKPDVTSITWSHKRHNSTGPIFHIANVTQSDEGRLMCTAQNGAGTSPGWADIFIQVLGKNQERLGAGTSTWTSIHTGAVVTGAVAVVIIVVLVVLVIHFYRKQGSASVQNDWKGKAASVGASNALYNQEDCESDDEDPFKTSEDATPASSTNA